MTRLLLITLFLLSRAPAYAEWVEVGGSIDGNMTTYADPSTIRHKGNMVKMWGLYDFKTIQPGSGTPYLSRKWQNEYDCADEQIRFLAFYLYSGAMGTGDLVYFSVDPWKWTPVSPGSVNQSMWKLACKAP